MRRLQIAFLLLLLLAPLAALVGAGIWTLWRSGWLFYLWWALPLGWGLAMLLQRRWRVFLIPMPAAVLEPSLHWTPQDEVAAKLVEARQKQVDQIDAERLAEPTFYVETASEIAHEIARHYHPHAQDAWSSATIAEILAAAQLALADLEEWAGRYVPGSHLVTLKTWQKMAAAHRWRNVAYNAYWAASVLLNPINLGRYVASKLAIDPLSDQLQANVLAVFYVYFVREVGFYAIEMNSGRLRGGAAKYRAAMARMQAGAAPASLVEVVTGKAKSAPAAAVEPLTVTIAVVGQAKAGKSSLVNALLGERKAATDVLPATRGITEYRLALPGSADRLVLLDTAGYGADEDAAKAWADARDAVERADLVLLVMKSTSPARAADVRFVEAMDEANRADPRRRPPPVLGVLTHIDGLSPALEWSPPYRWETPTSAKEEHIRDAVADVAELFGDHFDAVVPVCGDIDRNRAWGVQEALAPAVTELLGEARGCALLRALHAELDEGRLRRVLDQALSAGKRLIELYRTRSALPQTRPTRE